MEIYSLIPNEGYMVVHLLALVLGAYGASLALGKGWKPVGMLLGLYAVSELLFLLAHLDVLNFYFSHLLAEVLLLVGVVIVLKSAMGGEKAAKK